jgi:putative tryptophan/tyrosine transport system substrate-binding protein
VQRPQFRSFSGPRAIRSYRYTEADLEAVSKYLSLLKELLPRLHRIGVLQEAGNPYNRVARGQFENICQSLDLEAVVVEIAVAAEIAGVIAQLARQHVQALVLENSPFAFKHRLEIVDAATNHGWPTMAEDASMVREGRVLIAYAATQVEQDQVRAYYIDRILRGARPADLPVRRPTKFEMAINLKTARALGLTIPKGFLLRADEVIQ